MEPIANPRISFSLQDFIKHPGYVRPLLVRYHEGIVTSKFFHKESFYKTTAKVLAVVAVVALCGTGYGAFYLTAAPHVVIGTTLGCFAVTVVSGISSALCFFKKTFWNDPVYRANRGIAAADDIISNHLSHAQVMKKYGSDINMYQILSNDDLETLLFTNEIQNCKSYKIFVERNGKQAIYLFKSENKEELSHLFIEHVKTISNFEEIKAKHREEIKYFGISDDLLCMTIIDEQIQKVLNNELPYLEFRMENNRLDLLNLDEGQKQWIKSKFLKELGLTDMAFGLIKTLSIYQTDLKIFGIKECEVEEIILLKEFKMGDYFPNFLTRNGPNCIIKLLDKHPTTFESMRKSFLQDLSFMEAMNEYVTESHQLKLTFEELENGILPKELKHCYDYFEFEVRNGTSAYVQLLKIDPEYKEDLKNLLLKLPYKDMCKENYRAPLSIMGIQFADIEKVIDADAYSLRYFDFFKKHGLETFQGGTLFSGTAKELLFTKLLDDVKVCKIEDIKKYETHFPHWQIDYNQCYRARWNAMRMQDILKNDLIVFNEVKNDFKKYFEEKVLNEIENLSIKLILQNHKKYFELDLINSQSLLKGYLIGDLVDEEVKELNTMDKIYAKHNDFLFKHHLVNTGSSKFKKIVSNYLNDHFDEIMNGTYSECFKMILNYEFLSKKKIKALDSVKILFEKNLQDYNTKLNSYKAKCKIWVTDRLTVIQNIKNERAVVVNVFKIEVDKFQKTVEVWEKSLSDVSLIKDIIVVIQKNLEKVSQEKLDQDTLKLADLEKQIEILENEKGVPVTGIRAAWTHGEFDKKIGELKKNRESIKGSIKLNNKEFLEKELSKKTAELKNLLEVSEKAEKEYKFAKYIQDKKIEEDKLPCLKHNQEVDKINSQIAEFERVQIRMEGEYFDFYRQSQHNLKTQFFA